MFDSLQLATEGRVKNEERVDTSGLTRTKYDASSLFKFKALAAGWAG